MPGSCGGQWKVIAADWIVMPRALSAGRKSVTVEPSSTSLTLSTLNLALVPKPLTSYSTRVATVVEHALRGRCLSLSRGQYDVLIILDMVTHSINVGHNANIASSFRQQFCL